MSEHAAEPGSASVPSEPAWSIGLVVRRLIGARHGGPSVAAERVLSAVRSADEAYQVQARVDAALWPQASPAVWKAGADSRETLPTAAPIAPALVFASGAVLSAAKFPIRIVEAEIAYRFGVDLPPRAVAYNTDEVAEAIVAMHVAIEVVTPRIADHQTASSLAKLADHGLNGAFVLGDGIEAWRRVDLRKQTVVLSIGGKVVETATGSHGLGNPAVLLPWFVAHLGRLPTWDEDGVAGPPRGVKAGDVVTTGSWTKVAEARAKQAVAVRFDGIGSVSVSFDA